VKEAVETLGAGEEEKRKDREAGPAKQSPKGEIKVQSGDGSLQVAAFREGETTEVSKKVFAGRDGGLPTRDYNLFH